MTKNNKLSRVTPLPLTNDTVKQNASAVIQRMKGTASGKRLDKSTTELTKMFHRGELAREGQVTTYVALMSEALSPYVACKKGCSHCCWQSVIISTIEAARISDHTGRAIDNSQAITFPNYRNVRDEYIRKSSGVKCPFLSTSGACSIYQVRPLVCRTHFNLSEFPEWCALALDTDGLEVPYMDTQVLHSHAMQRAHNKGARFGDIRDFFLALNQ